MQIIFKIIIVLSCKVHMMQHIYLELSLGWGKGTVPIPFLSMKYFNIFTRLIVIVNFHNIK